MNTHSYRHLLAATLALSLPLLALTHATRSGDLPPPTRPGLCSWMLVPQASQGGAPQHFGGFADAIERTPASHIAGLIGALGQLIVEAELSHAAVSGRFEPVIHAAAAGADFLLEVCRDAIVGEVYGAQRPGVRFVIGDFDGDGATDVAVHRDDSPAWAVELGALRNTGLWVRTPAQLCMIHHPESDPGVSEGAQSCRVTWLVEVVRQVPPQPIGG